MDKMQLATSYSFAYIDNIPAGGFFPIHLKKYESAMEILLEIGVISGQIIEITIGNIRQWVVYFKTQKQIFVNGNCLGLPSNP